MADSALFDYGAASLRLPVMDTVYNVVAALENLYEPHGLAQLAGVSGETITE